MLCSDTIAATAIYSFLGLKYIVAIDLTTFIIAFATLAFFVRIPEIYTGRKISEENLWKQCKAGIIYLIGRRDIFSLILFMGFVNFIAAIYNTNLSPMVLSRSGNNTM